MKVFNNNEVFKWDGSLDDDMKNILTILRPFCSTSQWKAMISWTLLGMRLLVPTFSDKILNKEIKIYLQCHSLYFENVFGNRNPLEMAIKMYKISPIK